jgi:transcriptional regulator with XRE-family HTH domain
MFRQLPNYLGAKFNSPDAQGTVAVTSFSPRIKSAEDLFNRHPQELVTLMESYWNKRKGLHNPGPTPLATPNLGHPDRLSDEGSNWVTGEIALLNPDDELWLRNFSGTASSPIVSLNKKDGPQQGYLRWDHLIYAYMVENTRVFEIFRRVLHEYRHGEKLGAPIDSATQNWLRNTEMLFYSESAPVAITNVSSHVRSDLRANRRNAYQRMFGMDLNHGAEDGKPYSYLKAEASNAQFVAIFEEFLREVWVGITYVDASNSSNPTDQAKIRDLVNDLCNMLQSRRQSGNLAREEFAFVAMMSWFHLTLESNNSVIMSLRAEASGTENRLFKIAERVGLPAHGLSGNFFDIADPLSNLLILIETGTFNDIANVPALYDPAAAVAPTSATLVNDMRTIITHWTAITGRDIKARKVMAG